MLNIDDKKEKKTLKKIGKIKLLVAGICLLIVGLWSLVTTIIGHVAAIAGLVSDKYGATGIFVLGLIIFIISLICLICYIFAGVRGIKTFTKGDENNINRAFIWAIIIIVLNVASLIAGGFNLSSIIGISIDVAYVVGAFFVKFSK